MSCKRHKWSNGQMRMLPYVIRRGCQEANAEIFEKCSVCGKEKRSKYAPPPNLDTLRRWARDLKIFPFPQKVGRTYYVEPDAEYRDHRQHGT
jgi:hypothetical protein